MVLCVVFGCGSRGDRDEGIGFDQIPSVIQNKSTFEEELTRERREKWIKAISRGDTMAKYVLKSERVCGKHFVSGKLPFEKRRVPILYIRINKLYY